MQKIIFFSQENLFFLAENLTELKSANFSASPFVDDWFIDRMTDLNWLNIEHIDLSHCKNVTGNGLTLLSKIRYVF